MEQTATAQIPTAPATGHLSMRAFLRHFGEMVLAMLVGMVVLGGVAELVLAVAGTSFSDTQGTAEVLLR